MQSFPQQAACWLCPKCGEITKYILHNDSVEQHKRTSIKPILPTCMVCGAEISICHSPGHNPDTMLIVLTGTCASGKSTTAEVLIARHGFYGIDGNCVSDVIRHKYGITRFAFNGIEMLREIEHEIDILLSLKQNIVLSHIITPGDLPAYREMFRSRGLNYIVFVLQPRYPMAVMRSRERNVFQTITSEEWVKHFHDAMDDFMPEDDVVILDNSEFDAEICVEKILQLYCCNTCSHEERVPSAVDS